jgi:two-component system osmolarity sensor histidine kinase EnvZ
VLELNNHLDRIILEKMSLYRDAGSFVLEIRKADGILKFNIALNRLYIIRVDLIVFWNVFSFLVISAIAIIFVKNQIRSIDSLKKIVSDFSFLEKENSNFKPTGAKEIREMGVAFLNIINKMKKLLNSRTMMLAQISHDLRTPLTRMKLQTEFIEDKAMADFFRKDLEEMEELINEYILFAKGESDGERAEVNVKNFFDNIVNDYRRSGYSSISISYNLDSKSCFINENSFKRAINNIINNSLKYGRREIVLGVKTTKQKLLIAVEDDGDGISNNSLKKIERLFFMSNKEDGSRAQGNGLGLSIVRQIVSGHRGSIKLLKSKKLGGLMVSVIIPIKNNNRKGGNVAKNSG